MPDTEKQISTSDAMGILVKYVPDIGFTMINALVVVNPIWAVLFVAAKGIYGAWGDFGQSRLNELTTELADKKNTFDPEVLETDKFKSIFLSILERHMKESLGERRKLFRKYLISVAQGENHDFDYHTKLLNIMDQITGDELRLLMLLPTIIKDSNDEYLAYASEEQRNSFDAGTRDFQMNTLQIKMRLKNWRIKTKDLAALIRFLTNYGLIVTYDVSAVGIGGGGNNDLAFSGLTAIGSVFYDFIDDTSFDKEITNWKAYQNDPGLSRTLQY
jgi:hypothetical protein